jgi:hypothetical protein
MSIEGLTDEEIVERFRWRTKLLNRVDDLRDSGVRNVTFSVYRRGDISDTHTAGQVNAPDEVQFDGVLFDDDVTVIHWNTEVRSTAVFEDFFDLLEIHGHPEEKYLTEFKFEGEE